MLRASQALTHPETRECFRGSVSFLRVLFGETRNQQHLAPCAVVAAEQICMDAAEPSPNRLVDEPVRPLGRQAGRARPAPDFASLEVATRSHADLVHERIHVQTATRAQI